MTPLRWNWSANTRCSLKSGRVSDLASFQRLTTSEVPLAASMVASSGRWPPAVPRIVARRLAQCTRDASRAPTGPLGCQLTDTLLDHRSLAPSPTWAGRDGEGRSGSKGGEGPTGGGNRCRCADGSSFSADHPRLVCCNDFKDASAAAAPSSTDSTDVAIPKRQKRLPSMTPLRWNWSANTRCSLKPARVSDLASRFQQLTPTMSRKRLRWSLRAGPGPRAVPRTVARRVAR
jgi:hypothetical protein